MPTTLPSNWGFDPVVWSMHAKAYKDRKLRLGVIAEKSSDLKEQGTGLTVNYPYFRSAGPGQQIGPAEAVTYEGISDDSFPVTVREYVKGLSVTRAALYASSVKDKEEIADHMQEQAGRALAELIDDGLNNEVTKFNGGPTPSNANIASLDLSKFDNMEVVYKSAGVNDTFNVRIFLKAMVDAFGDKANETTALYLHSRVWSDFLRDSNAGFLKADANSPYNAMKEYLGSYLGVSFIMVDSCKKVGQINNKDVFLSHFHKPGPYGILEKQDIMFEEAKDMSFRQENIQASSWWGVTSFHKKISDLDKKSGGILTVVS